MNDIEFPENLRYPDWLTGLIDWKLENRTPEQCIWLANEAAYQNVMHQGGPFAAIIADENGRIISAGSNRVVDSRDTTAHAEILAIRRANYLLGTHNFVESRVGPLTLYSSAAPCIMCFGAIWWSGLAKVYSSSTKEDAQTAGFEEGPVVPQMWELLHLRKGVEYTAEFCRDVHALCPFEAFVSNGVLY